MQCMMENIIHTMALVRLWSNNMRFFKKNIYTIGKVCLIGIFLIYLLDLLFPFRFKIDYSTVVKDRDGNILSCYLSKDQQWRFLFEDNDFNEDLTNAFIQKEDKYFYYHFGINPIAICRAFINNSIYTGTRNF